MHGHRNTLGCVGGHLVDSNGMWALAAELPSARDQRAEWRIHDASTVLGMDMWLFRRSAWHVSSHAAVVNPKIST